MASLSEQFFDDFESSEDELPKDSKNDSQQSSASNAAGPPLANAGDDALSGDIATVLTAIESNACGNGSEEDRDLVSCAVRLVTRLDEAIGAQHRSLEAVFGHRFPELSTIVLDAEEYGRVVQLVGNLEDISGVDLSAVLSAGVVITVQVTAASSKGRLLTAVEVARAQSLAAALLAHGNARRRVLAHIEGRAGALAPNLTAVVGAAVAAALLGIAGGVRELASMPACNVKVIGKAARILGGQSTQTARPHEGVVYQAPIVTALPPALRPKGGQVVAGKASLAARIDAAGSSRDGAQGRALRAALDAKFDKWKERNPAKSLQPLPIPGEVKRTHRAGRRARKEKERMGMTDARKLKNRVRFGVAEVNGSNNVEDGGLGMLAGDSQRVRIATKANNTLPVTAERKIAKARRKQRRNMASSASGFATNLAFGNSHGIELGAMTPAPGGVGLGENNDGAKSQYFDVDTPFVAAARSKQSQSQSSTKNNS